MESTGEESHPAGSLGACAARIMRACTSNGWQSACSHLARLAPISRRPAMLKVLVLTVIVGGVVAVSAAMPGGFVLVANTDSLREPGAMLLLATALFAIASVVRRRGKPPRRR